MSKDALQDNLYWNLLQVSLRAKKNTMKMAEEHGLNIMQLFVLCSMERDRTIPTHFISSLLVCDASTTTGIIDFLAERGLTDRAESPQDRRVKMLKLTDKGDALKQELLTAIRDFQSDALDGLDDGQKAQLQDLLSIVIRTASK